MVTVETIVKCDICGREMKESELGHKHFPCYLVLGLNNDESSTMRYDDVCGDCSLKIKKLIDELSGTSAVNQYFTQKLRETEKK
jgi:hypothetical protein